MKEKTNKTKAAEKIFASTSFLIFTEGLKKGEIAQIYENVLENGGSLESVDESLDGKSKLKGDYILCDPRLDAVELRSVLPTSILYKEALDVSYIEVCIASGNLLPVTNFKLRVHYTVAGEEPQKKTKIDPIQPNEENSYKQIKEPKLKDITKPSNNKFIIDELNKLYKVYSNEGDKGRKIAYSKAIAAIKSLDKELETDDDVDQLKHTQKGIGIKIVDKIKELLKTGSIRKLEMLKNTDENIALEDITRVWGIGSAKAKEMYQRGVRNIADLRREVEQHPDILTKNQKVGLKYVEDLEIRIPRKKVDLMASVVKETLYDLTGSKNSHEVEICGSYRRGKPTCGDMDIFITRKDGEYEKELLSKLVQKLEQKHFLTDHLTMPRTLENHSCQSYMGICNFKDELHHRIDIKYYPVEEFAFAVLYFTGSDMFNRKMRIEAIEKGYHLSDHGMYKVKKDAKTKIEEKGANIKCRTEKEIFDVLGIEYKEPKDRDV